MGHDVARTTNQRAECTVVTTSVGTSGSKAAYYYCGEAIPQPATAYCCPETVNGATGRNNGGHMTPMPTNFNRRNNSKLQSGMYYDPYQVLHLRRDATLEEIALAYRRVAVLTHPSRATVGAAAAAQFAAVAAAYETLSVSETRQRMDNILSGRGGLSTATAAPLDAVERSRENDGDNDDTHSQSGNLPKPRTPDRTLQELEFRKQLQTQRRQALRHRKEAKRLAKKKRRGLRGMVSTAVQNRKRRKTRAPTTAPRSSVSTVTPPPPNDGPMPHRSPKNSKRAYTAIIAPLHQRAPVSSVSESVDDSERDDEEEGIEVVDDDSSFFTAEDDEESTSDAEVVSRATTDDSTNRSNVPQSGLPKNIFTSTISPIPSKGPACLAPIYSECIMMGGEADKDDSTSDEDGEETTILFSEHASRVSKAKPGATEATKTANSKSTRITPFPRSLPALVQSSTTCSTTREDVQHYSQGATERLFGGPLQLMFQARRWQPFTDPNAVFERMFGSALVGNRDRTNTVCSNQIGPESTRPALVAAASPSAWAGNTETLPDGSIVNIKSRTVQDAQGRRRRLKRTVTRLPADPQSGLCRTTITVTSEDLDIDGIPLETAKTSRATSHTSPCPDELCSLEMNEQQSMSQSQQTACCAGKEKAADSATASTTDDDWSFSSMCQSWLSPCCQ
jgi:DnaJ domain